MSPNKEQSKLIEAQLRRALRLSPTERIRWLEQNKRFMMQIRPSRSSA